uniref:Uncharacterized protein n=1 Tax=mine drainage metagenome TaxID=410659 RepID=E6QQA4_9ZZZZ
MKFFVKEVKYYDITASTRTERGIPEYTPITTLDLACHSSLYDSIISPDIVTLKEYYYQKHADFWFCRFFGKWQDNIA